MSSARREHSVMAVKATSMQQTCGKGVFIEEVECIGQDYGCPQPWPLPGVSEERKLLVLQPHFSRDKLYHDIMESTQSNLTPSDRAVERLFNSDRLRHVVLTKSERGVCKTCFNWNVELQCLRSHANSKDQNVAKRPKSKCALFSDFSARIPTQKLA